ncbi:hypothetical protein EDB89DRAFT_2033029 [Lactarius sanguifluus]|nr:hypothetical protein EDB89DRAFT_2033029 [Lactarius sanguifluus]
MALAAARFCLATSPLLSRYCVCGITPHPIHGAIHAHTLRSIFAWCMRSITSSMYCSTRCQLMAVCFAPAYWIDPLVTFICTLCLFMRRYQSCVMSWGCQCRLVAPGSRRYHQGARFARGVCLHAMPFYKVLSVTRDVVGVMLFDEYRVHSRGVKLSRAFLMPCQLTLAFWHHPRARRALSQDAIGRALCVMDTGVTQFVLDARIIGSALYQLRSTFDMP